MIYIDTHTHIYDKQFSEDINEVLSVAQQHGVMEQYMPNCDSTTIESMLNVADKYPTVCYPMMGLHPCYVKENYKEELNIVGERLKNNRYIAVGEIGLDYYWDISFKEQQIEAFNTQIDLALQYDLPIVIHSRESLSDCIKYVTEKQNGNLSGVFHCFGGNAEEAKEIIDLGFYLGIGGVVTFKNSNLDEALKQCSLDNIVLETDAPYLAPVPYRGKRNESSYIPLIAQKLADIFETNIQNVAKATTVNAKKLFKKDEI